MDVQVQRSGGARQGDARGAAVGQQPLHRLRNGSADDGLPRDV